MENKKMDRRIKYTKMVIRDSFISLLKQKSISKITVKEICEIAEINRATFYAHYTDAFDLLYQIETEVINDITKYLATDIYSDATRKNSSDTLEKILEYIKKDSELFSILLEDYGDSSFKNQIISFVEIQVTSNWTSNNVISSEDINYLFTFAAVGSVGLIKKWLNEGMKKSSKELADLILKVSLYGTTSF